MPEAINPKPTTYRGTTFRSRLEARWAVFLSTHPHVNSWKYEPFTLALSEPKWEYTPDFEIQLGRKLLHPTTLLLEVKPTLPSAEYETVLNGFGRALADLRYGTERYGTPMYLVAGDFYKMNFSLIRYPRPHSCPTLSQLFPDFRRYMLYAAQFRFDLKE